MKVDSFLKPSHFLLDFLPAEIVLGHDEQIIDEVDVQQERTFDMS